MKKTESFNIVQMKLEIESFNMIQSNIWIIEHDSGDRMGVWINEHDSREGGVFVESLYVIQFR